VGGEKDGWTDHPSIQLFIKVRNCLQDYKREEKITPCIENITSFFVFLDLCMIIPARVIFPFSPSHELNTFSSRDPCG